MPIGDTQKWLFRATGFFIPKSSLVLPGADRLVPRRLLVHSSSAADAQGRFWEV